ncbi:hypothetical protein M441DRAFT_213550 [Trichoderma asperellum CBS 433.97]|uniref:Uncharacterized protein n=1 Tax=Trichoderma asperellum (strain ATCC 204424 / CBS 433.97 / NBRC 101777) TaxID=1042311 RepID=A0A2T3ZNE6_TRIA4|nr:hypothetical protein M441DRAFT_213550 [Trichoderma asperellum CBS 433.97]PTB46335.1 hypothetical protein M441DRAFT_213550 [Trichoderma asperellum CBS 433.97]
MPKDVIIRDSRSPSDASSMRLKRHRHRRGRKIASSFRCFLVHGVHAHSPQSAVVVLLLLFTGSTYPARRLYELARKVIATQ